MISWGTKYYVIGQFDDVMEEKCAVCSSSEKAIYSVEQAVFSLYGLNLFPTSKKYYKTCPACDARLKVRSNDSNLPTVKRAIPGGIKFRYIWGWIILLPILIGIAYLIMQFKPE